MNAKFAAPVLISALALAACADSGPAVNQEHSQADDGPQIMDGPSDPVALICPGTVPVSFRFMLVCRPGVPRNQEKA